MSTHPAPPHAISQATIEQFLQILARNFQQPSNLYLTGDTALVHLGLRAGTTHTLNLVLEAADEKSMAAIARRGAAVLHMNTDFTSPEHLIPISWTWQNQARYVGPYGYIDVFYFDFISLALSKIAQGTQSDLNDVWLLVRQKIIDLNNLDNAYLDIQPHMGKKPYDYIQPQQFTERYAQIRKWLIHAK